MAQTTLPKDSSQGMTLGEHIREFRSRLVRASLGVVLGTLAMWNFYDTFFAVIRKPFDHVHAHNPQAILALTGVTSGFSLQLRVSLAAGFIVSSPIWLYQLWRFIAPGLHKRERKWAYVYTLSAVPLFAAGILLAYVVMPRMLDVLYKFTPSNVTNVTSVDSYLSFFLHLTLFFGCGFLLPLILVMLNFAGILSGRTILTAWRWIILGSFVLGAVATPSGDPLGMTLIALPVMFLAFVAAGIASLNDRRRAKRNLSEGTNQWSDNEASPLVEP